MCPYCPLLAYSSPELLGVAFILLAVCIVVMGFMSKTDSHLTLLYGKLPVVLRLELCEVCAQRGALARFLAAHPPVPSACLVSPVLGHAAAYSFRSILSRFLVSRSETGHILRL